MTTYDHTATATLTLNASPAAVWAVLADLDKLASWAPGIDASAMKGAATEGIGAVRLVTTAQFGEIAQEITGWQPEVQLAYVTQKSGPFTATHTAYDLMPVDDGTQVRATLDFNIAEGAMPPEKAQAALTQGLTGILKALEMQARVAA